MPPEMASVCRMSWVQKGCFRIAVTVVQERWHRLPRHCGNNLERRSRSSWLDLWGLNRTELHAAVRVPVSNSECVPDVVVEP